MAKRKQPTTKKKTPKSSDTGKFVGVRHIEGGLGAFANHMIVQQTTDEFHLSFFQIHPPIVLGDDKDRKSQLEKIDHVMARPVARIIVTKSKMPAIIAALQNQLDKSNEAEKAGGDN